MSIREQLRGAFKSEKWKLKVDAMSDQQVYAIYHKFKRERKI